MVIAKLASMDPLAMIAIGWLVVIIVLQIGLAAWLYTRWHGKPKKA
ncbi:hypothetical protein [Pseudaquidulcibacter saccharophilus]|nr:hypothetical protein [Pseudaquidulcibacter saccharophilus]